MSTIFRNPPSPALDSNTHYHARSLHQNCFLAPPHARNTPPPSNKYAVSPSGFVSIGSPSTPTCSSPNTAAGSDYFNLSRNSTPTTTPGGYSNPPPGDLDPNLTTAKFRLKTLVPPMKKNGSASVSLQPFTTADAPALAILFERCFATDELRLTAKPPHKTNPSDPLEERRWRICQYTLALQIPGNHIVMAVDESAERKIIGVAGFFGPGGIQWTIKGPDGGNAVGEAVPSHWDMDMKARIDEVVDKAREEALKGDYNVWELSQLYVDPDYQRQGIGQRLLEWGLKQADEDGYPVYLEGTTSAKPFYEKAGFATKAEPVFPGVVGADGAEYKQYFMLRPVA